MTAVLGWLFAMADGAAADDVFLLALSHHFHNVWLADAGYAGELMLGEELAGVIERLTEGVLVDLPSPLADRIRPLRPLLGHADTPESRAFHAADAADRVVEMIHYDRCARFRVEHAVEDMRLVHPGPLQHFQQSALASLGLPGGSDRPDS